MRGVACKVRSWMLAEFCKAQWSPMLPRMDWYSFLTNISLDFWALRLLLHRCILATSSLTSLNGDLSVSWVKETSSLSVSIRNSSVGLFWSRLLIACVCTVIQLRLLPLKVRNLPSRESFYKNVVRKAKNEKVEVSHRIFFVNAIALPLKLEADHNRIDHNWPTKSPNYTASFVRTAF